LWILLGESYPARVGRHEPVAGRRSQSSGQTSSGRRDDRL